MSGALFYLNTAREDNDIGITSRNFTVNIDSNPEKSFFELLIKEEGKQIDFASIFTLRGLTYGIFENFDAAILNLELAKGFFLKEKSRELIAILINQFKIAIRRIHKTSLGINQDQDVFISEDLELNPTKISWYKFDFVNFENIEFRYDIQDFNIDQSQFSPHSIIQLYCHSYSDVKSVPKGLLINGIRYPFEQLHGILKGNLFNNKLKAIFFFACSMQDVEHLSIFNDVAEFKVYYIGFTAVQPISIFNNVFLMLYRLTGDFENSVKCGQIYIETIFGDSTDTIKAENLVNYINGEKGNSIYSIFANWVANRKITFD